MSSEIQPANDDTANSDIQPRSQNDLTPPSNAAGCIQRATVPFQNAAIPMPGEWAPFPGILNWNVGFYCYKINDSREAYFVMIHNGSTNTLVSDYALTHTVTSSESGAFELQLPRTNSGELLQGTNSHRYTIQYQMTLNLTDTSTNPMTFQARYQDTYIRTGFVQTGDISSNATFQVRRAPLPFDGEPGSGEPVGKEPRTFLQMIRGLTTFRCAAKAVHSDYSFTFSLRTDAGTVSQTVIINF